jgi:superfamily II DNA or RNA helicase
VISAYHTKYFAYELTRRCPPDSVEKLAGALIDAQVDLNPHQVDAALFAFNSPLSKGALLADEVGLGKTIEAGLVLSQKWAERKRRILVITPSNLRKQWYQELAEKFFLPCRILEAKPYNAAIKQGQFRPFEAPEIVICSYQFAKSKAGDVHAVPWDLVVIDEAHRLRNVYKPSNVIANTLKQALAGKHKLPVLIHTAEPFGQAQAAAHGDPFAEFAARVVRPGELHRRTCLRRLEEFPRAVRQPGSGTGVRDAQGASQARLPPHLASAGYGVHPLHQAPAVGRRIHARGERRSALPPRFRIPAT